MITFNAFREQKEQYEKKQIEKFREIAKILKYNGSPDRADFYEKYIKICIEE